jgi:HK97 family phage prohead protease
MSTSKRNTATGTATGTADAIPPTRGFKVLADAAVKQEGAPDSRKFTFVFSSSEPDRDNDIIDQAGIDLAAFKQNPVVLWAHDHRTPPVARVPATWIRNGKLMGTIEFPPEGTTELSDSVHNLVAAGFIRATSIGFDPTEWTFDEKRGGYNFKKIDLFEVSLVNVPANADALIAAEKAGVDIKPVLDHARGVLDKVDVAAEMEKVVSVAVEKAVDDLRREQATYTELTEFAELPDPVIRTPDGYTVEKQDDGAYVVAPPAPPVPAAPVSVVLRKPTAEERKAIIDLVTRFTCETATAEVKKVVAREISNYTGRLED